MRTESATRKKWLISQDVWKEISALLPPWPRHELCFGGRPRVSDYEAMSGIFFVLKTGCQWKALDATSICSSSTAHRRFEEWVKAGVFHSFWKVALERYDRIIGIDWRWLSLDCSFHKSPVAGSEKVGRNPTDRGKLGVKHGTVTDAIGIPIGITTAPANWHDSRLLIATLESIPVRRPRPTTRKRQHLCLDKAFDSAAVRSVLSIYKFVPHIRKIGEEKKHLPQGGRSKPRRWVVERSHSWFNRKRAILIRWEKDPVNYEALLHIEAALICFQHLGIV